MTGPSDEPRRWLRIGHLELSDLLVETFSVLLGVLLALLINAWVQKRQTQDKVGEAMASIRQELRTDRETLETLRSYHHQLIGTIDVALKSPHPPLYCNDLDGWHGIYSPFESQLLRAAYDTATASGVFSDMNFEDTRRVANLYARISSYEAFYAKALDWMIQERVATQAQGFDIQVCRGLLHDLDTSGQKLEQALDDYLNQK
jgi:hypothetical protein